MTSTKLETSRERTIRWSLIFGALITVVVIAAFFLPFWNRFVGIRSGNGNSWMGFAFCENLLPYRDYYCPVPFLPALKEYACLLLLGHTLVAVRIGGILTRIAIGLVLYGWLSRFFKSSLAMLAAITTTIVASVDMLDSVDYYHFDAILLGTLGGFCSHFALDKNVTSKRLLLAATLSGAFCFAAAMSKQSLGVGASLFVPFAAVVLLWSLRAKKILMYLLSYLAGWLSMAALSCLYLMHEGLFQNFVYFCFVVGPAAKSSGSALGFLRREVFFLGQNWQGLVGGLGMFFFWLPLFRKSLTEEPPKEPNQLPNMAKILVVSLLAVIVGISLCYVLPLWLQEPFKWLAQWLFKSLDVLVYFGTMFLVLSYTKPLLASMRTGAPISNRAAQLYFFCTVGFCITFTLALSCPLFEVMLPPGLALFLAVALEGQPNRAKRVRIAAFCASLVSLSTLQRMNSPFSYETFVERPVVTANTRSSIPILEGLILPDDTVHCLESIRKLVLENSTVSDRMYVYPQMEIFSLTTGRKSCNENDAGGASNMDILTDAKAENDARLLLKSRPKILIFAHESEALLKLLENFWKGGAESGNRKIIAACKELAKQYKLVGSFNFGSCRFAPDHDLIIRTSPMIDVYVREDAPSK
ncbi:MAG TPA: hypothetical protein V6C97_37245 [Oculatellaceae cyanobacterium]